MSLQSDKPHADPKKDVFERRGFAARIAQTIARRSDSDGLVMSIDGAWGDGKSTVLGFVKAELDELQVANMEFNPWRYSSEETLLIGFFLKLAETIDVQLLSGGQKMRRAIEEQCPWITDAAEAGTKLMGAWLPTAMTAAARAISAKVWVQLSPNLDKLRKKIQVELDDRRKKIVILVDDPDRLDADELFALFRLIKLTADFPYTVFLLAMDHEMVSEAIGKRFSDDETAGRKFLEKLIQVPLRIPLIPRASLDEFVFENLKRVWSSLELKIDEEELSRCKGLYNALIAPKITTPRLAKQFANVSYVSLGMLPGEVNTVDVLILEGLRLFCPSVFDVISKSESELFGISIFPTSREGRESPLREILALCGEVSEQGREALEHCLPRIFPQLARNPYYEVSDFDTWDRQQRVCSEHYFWRYFRATVPSGDVPDSVVAGIANAANSGDKHETVNLTKAALLVGSDALIANKLRLAIAQLQPRGLHTLPLAMAEVAPVFSKRRVANMFDQPFGQTAVIAARCVELQPTEESQVSHAQEILTWQSSPDWLVTFFIALPLYRSQEDEGVGHGAFSKRQTEEITKVALGCCRKIIEEQGIEAFGDRASSCVQLLRDFGELDFIADYCKSRVERDPAFALQVLSYSTGRRWSGDSMSYIWNGEETVRKVQSLVPIDLIANQITKLVADAAFPASEAVHDGFTLERLAQTFLERATRKETSNDSAATQS